jgi:hypothetical protein
VTKGAMKRGAKAVRFLFLALAAVAAPAFGQNVGSAAHPDLSGYWELRFDSMSVPRASLATPVTAAIAEAQARHDVEAIRWCNNLGVPFILEDRAPLDIRQSPTVVAMVAKVQSSARYIFTDGRKHPDKEDLDPTTNGHSVGHWEGDTLVADTVGFNDRGATRIPGGGIRTPASHLMERFRLLDGGARLSAVFTWDDAKTFQKPHSYEFRYYKIPQISEPRILPCDQGDQDRARFLLGPDAPK